MAPPRRIHIRGLYDSGNLGDDLTLAGLLLFLDEFAAEHGPIEVILERGVGALHSVVDELTLTHLSIRYCDPLWPLFAGTARGPRLLRLAMKAIRIGRFALSLRSERSSRRLAGDQKGIPPNVEILHYAGGGYLSDTALSILARELLISRLLKQMNPGMQITGTGLGVGPARLGTRWLFRSFFRQLSIPRFRDALSAEIAGWDEDSVLGDDAFLLTPWVYGIIDGGSENRNKSLGLNLRSFKDFDVDKMHHIAFYSLRSGRTIDTFSFASTRLGSRTGNLAPSLLPQGTFHEHRAYEKNLRDFLISLSQAERAMGTAFHFCLLSAMMCIPVLALCDGHYYHQKMIGLSLTLPGVQILDMSGEHYEATVRGFLKSERPPAATRADSLTVHARLVADYRVLYRMLLGIDATEAR